MSYIKARTAWATVDKAKEKLEEEPGYNAALLVQKHRRDAQIHTNKLREKFRVVE